VDTNHDSLPIVAITKQTVFGSNPMDHAIFHKVEVLP